MENPKSETNSSHMQRSEQRRQFFRAFEAKSLRSRSLLTQLSDRLTAFCGSTGFLLFHILFFTVWILINTDQIRGVPAFDPYPFGFLTMVVSLEAIFLALFILVSQNRQSYINSLREEVHLRVNLIAEEEITKALELLQEMRQEMGIKRKDEQLQKMLEKLDTYNIEKSIEEQMARASKSLHSQMLKEFPNLLTYPVRKPVELLENIANGEEKNSKSS